MRGWLGLSEGEMLARFRSWLDRKPRRLPSEIGLAHKLGRIALIVAVVVVIFGPAIWMFAG
jgi:hypothetical protein